jgi:NADH-quinone oxidoreductase subunit F
MGKKILTEHINVPGIETYEVYRKVGGYASVEKALKMTIRSRTLPRMPPI